MKREELPNFIKSPITGYELELKDTSFHNNEELSVAQFFDSSTEWFDDCVMYRNDVTNEIVYIPVKRYI
jgi:hypothetical protein